MALMPLLDAVSQDVRYAARLLWRDRAFTTAAVSTLALGIAATTVMFALIQGVLLRPLPVQEQDRLILSWREAPTAGSAFYPFGDAEIEVIGGVVGPVGRDLVGDRDGLEEEALGPIERLGRFGVSPQCRERRTAA